MPKKRAINQAVKTSNPKKTSDVVDCEKTQRKGLKPRSRAAISARVPAIRMARYILSISWFGCVNAS